MRNPSSAAALAAAPQHLDHVDCEHKADLDAALTKIANLELALANSRSVGIAIGIVMATYKINDEAAFDLLVLASEKAQRTLREIADDVARTGGLTWGPGMLDKTRPRRRNNAAAGDGARLALVEVDAAEVSEAE